MEKVCFLQYPTVSHIPRSARLCFADKFEFYLENLVLNPTNVIAWLDFLFFPLLGLRKPKAQQECSLAKCIKQQILDFQGFVSDEIPVTGKTTTKKVNSKKPNKKNFATNISSKINEGNVKGAVKYLLSEDSLAEVSTPNAKILENKHPKALTEIHSDVLALNELALSVSPLDVITQMMKFPNGSAHGLDGLKPQHLKDMFHIKGDTKYSELEWLPSSLLTKYTTLINLILAGKVPAEIKPVLFGARLIALTKKDGGLRPIAIGCALRRLCSKLCCFFTKHKATEILAPIQVGVSVSGGAESMVHSTKHFLNDSNQCLLKIDFQNAFNSVQRGAFLAETQKHLPQIHNYSVCAYELESALLFGPHTIHSCTGVQQGDPIGPLLFSMAINPIITKLSLPLNVWYLDDGVIGGCAKDVITAFNYLIEHCNEIGLSINMSKCEFLSSNSNDNDNFLAIFPHVKKCNPSSSELLGIPLGGPGEISKHVEKLVQMLQKIEDKLMLIPQHIAYFLLIKCLWLPKITYLIRCSPSFQTNLTAIDITCRDLLSKILNLNLENSIWTQATLPIKDGGLGLRSLQSIAPSCYLSSRNNTVTLCNKILANSPTPYSLTDRIYQEGLQFWLQNSNASEPPSENAACKQNNWDRPVVEAQKTALLDSLDVSDKARFHSTSSKYSGSWLQCLPSANLGLCLGNDSFRLAVGLRLGAKLCEEHTCDFCGVQIDTKAHHILHCKRSQAGVINRHNQLNKLLYNTCQKSQLGAILEPRHISSSTNKHPDGVTVQPWSKGKTLAWDVTVISPTAASYVSSSSNAQGFSATAAANRKHEKYHHLKANMLFLPIVFETFGFIEQHSLNAIKTLGKLAKKYSHSYIEICYLLQNFSIVLQRSNAQILHNYFSNFNSDME